MSQFSFGERHWLFKQMEVMTVEDARYIMRLIKKNGDDFTENSNGCFFDLERLCDETIRELMVYYKHLRPEKDVPYYEEA